MKKQTVEGAQKWKNSYLLKSKLISWLYCSFAGSKTYLTFSDKWDYYVIPFEAPKLTRLFFKGESCLAFFKASLLTVIQNQHWM